jgi:hypothetical protein
VLTKVAAFPEAGPTTSSGETGAVVPMPTEPLSNTEKSGLLLELATTNPAVVAEVSGPVTESLPHGVEVPMPTFPFASTVISVEVELPPVVEAMVKSGVFAAVLAELEMERMPYGEVVPMPTLFDVFIIKAALPLPEPRKRLLLPEGL